MQSSFSQDTDADLERTKMNIEARSRAQKDRLSDRVSVSWKTQ